MCRLRLMLLNISVLRQKSRLSTSSIGGNNLECAHVNRRSNAARILRRRQGLVIIHRCDCSLPQPPLATRALMPRVGSKDPPLLCKAEVPHGTSTCLRSPLLHRGSLLASGSRYLSGFPELTSPARRREKGAPRRDVSPAGRRTRKQPMASSRTEKSVRRNSEASRLGRTRLDSEQSIYQSELKT